MIFKYCVWPDAAKDELNGKALINGTVNGTAASPVVLKPLSGSRKFTESLLGCCPCAFRCRRAIGIDSTERRIVDEVECGGSLAEPTPVLALRLNGSVDTMYEGLGDKEAGDHETDSNNSERNHGADSASPAGKSISLGDRAFTPRHDADEARSSSGSSSSSHRSAATTTSARRLLSTGQTSAAARPDSEASNGCRAGANSRASSSPRRSSPGKAFDVISDKSSSSRRDTPDPVSIRSEDEVEHGTSGSDEHNSPTALQDHHSCSGDSSDRASLHSAGRPRSRNLSLESLLSSRGDDPPTGTQRDGDRSPPAKSRLASRCSSERVFSARGTVTPPGSMVELNKEHGVAEEREPSESADEENDGAYETLDFRNSAREATGAASLQVVTSPVLSRGSYDYDIDLRNTDSNITLYSCNSIIMSPKSASPKRFISENPESKDTDSDETPPLPIGFDGVKRVESSDGTDETDDVSLKPQPSRLPTPVHVPSRQFKVSPCKLRPQANCNRASSEQPSRHQKHVLEKTSKAVQQCFTQLESKDWEVTLKGLRALAQIARDDPEQLDVCAPGIVARLLGKHVKNLRSQVSRVACSTATAVFSAHIRGIEQDIDEIAGPLLHRTADTNRFLREDCNAALDSMVEHYPPHRTIMTVANRGASHQNTVVHATTARLLYLIVTEIGPEHVMILPRDVKDKLLATTAKLLTDGNLQARKHAKETFRLLSRCQGFRKALTDAVPENTLRLIDKTLRTL